MLLMLLGFFIYFLSFFYFVFCFDFGVCGVCMHACRHELLCVCACVFVGCKSVCVHSDTEHHQSWYCLHILSLIFLAQVLSLNLQLTNSLGWQPSEVQGSVCLYLPLHSGVTNAEPRFFCRCWGVEIYL